MGSTRRSYYRARYYEPNAGRFISEDPIRFRGGINFYAYVANGPATFFDPTGLKKKCKDLPCDTTNLRLVPIYVQWKYGDRRDIPQFSREREAPGRPLPIFN